MSIFWRILARLITSQPWLVDWLITRAQRTPYTHITSADGKSIYMGRWWLFNAYGRESDGEQSPARFSWLPSVRIHHICRPDQDRDLHDHPWNARTIVLRGWYLEQLPANATRGAPGPKAIGDWRWCMRRTGDTGRLLFGEFHRIHDISEGGVWTLFISGPKRGTWGFMVNGKKVPWRTYLNTGKGGAA